MHYQVTERITTNAAIADVEALVHGTFRQIARSVVPVGHGLRVRSIHATFGSINRTDVTDVTINRTDDGYLLTANVDYHPSGFFWVFFVVFFCVAFVWLILLAFYLLQKETVRHSIEEAFRNVRNKLTTAGLSPHAAPSASPDSVIASLERIASLRAQGVITPDEFADQKQRLLGRPPTSAEPLARPPVPLSAEPPAASVPQTSTSEAEATVAFERARDCAKRGQAGVAVNILKDIVKKFPDTDAAARARKALRTAPRPPQK